MRTRGLTLIELLMALAIGAFLILGAVTICVRASGVYALSETLARLQENARYALNTLEPDVRLAGFWGLTSEARHIRGSAHLTPLVLPPRAARCGAQLVLDLLHPLGGTNNAYALPCPPVGGVQAGSDVLIVRYAEPAAVTPSAERLQLYTTRTGHADALFVGTAPLAAHSPSGAEIHDLAVRAYYVSPHATGQSGYPALRRKALGGGPRIGPEVIDEEIMPGVEDLQVQFGIDLQAGGGGDRTAAEGVHGGSGSSRASRSVRYVNPGDPALAGARVVVARIWIRVRAEAPETGYFDDRTYAYADVRFRPTGLEATYRRLVLSRIVEVRNAGGVRQFR